MKFREKQKEITLTKRQTNEIPKSKQAKATKDRTVQEGEINGWKR
jgi:hypothetical protein